MQIEPDESLWAHLECPVKGSRKIVKAYMWIVQDLLFTGINREDCFRFIK